MCLKGIRLRFMYDSRLLEPFQAGEASTFIEHAKAGLDELAKNERAILVFSGYVIQAAESLHAVSV